MGRREAILGGAAILVLALVVPAIGSGSQWFGLSGSSNETGPQGSSQGTAQHPGQHATASSPQARRALRRARRANRRASRALKRARRVGRRTTRFNQRVTGVNQRVIGLGQQVDRLGGLLDGTRVVSSTAPGLVSSTAPLGDFEALGGPSVDVTVPSSGLIEVWAQLEIADDDGGAVALYEDGRPVAGVSAEDVCGDDSVLIDFLGLGGDGDFVPVASPPTFNVVLGCGGFGAPTSLLLQRPPGPHTYELRYSECSCGGDARFRNRTLRVAPRL